MTGHLEAITIGVLALQGAFIEHITLLQQAARSLQHSYPPSPPQSSESENHSPPTNADPETLPSHASPPEVKDDKPPTFASPTSTEIHAALLAPRPRGNGTIAETTNNNQTHFDIDHPLPAFRFIQVRTTEQLSQCDALILPGGESTSISLIAERCGLLEPLRQYVKVQRKPVWGTCAGLILLAESANKSKETGQELIGGLDVRVHRNYFGRQVESFEADLDLAFLEDGQKFRTVFIRAPVVESVLDATTSVDVSAGKKVGVETVLAPPRQATNSPVEILGRLPGRARAIRDQTIAAEGLGEDGDIVAVRQGNVFGTAFHPELTGDERIHAWWLREVVRLKYEGKCESKR